MKKKAFVFFIIILFSVFSFTVCLATDDIGGLGTAANNVRNFVGGVENTVENAAIDISNMSKDSTGSLENNLDKNKTANKDTNANGKYTATRTSTDNTVMGMTTTAWTWLILGIAAIAIIAVVWYYSMQFTNNSNNHSDNE